MQAQQILMFDNREDFYNWVVKSDLALSEEEVKSNENKTSLIIKPINSIDSYVELTNYFRCDTIQSIGWTQNIEGEEKPRLNMVAIHISSLHFSSE